MTGTSNDDRALADRLADTRDSAAFRELYARHTPMLFAMALRLIGNETDAEDAVHDAWVRAVERIGRFRGESSLRTWLTGVLINRVREVNRTRVHDSLDDIGDVATHEPLTDVHDLHGVDPIDLGRAFAAMPYGYREVVLLHDVEGFTHEEIGRLLSIETGTSKSQLARGRRWLRRALGGASARGSHG